MIGQPCIGGPLNGKRATREDLRSRRIASRATLYVNEGDVLCEGGQYYMHYDEYVAYNRADRCRDRPSAVWLHRSLLP